jgi:hypothetical protein
VRKSHQNEIDMSQPAVPDTVSVSLVGRCDAQGAAGSRGSAPLSDPQAARWSGTRGTAAKYRNRGTRARTGRTLPSF